MVKFRGLRPTGGHVSEKSVGKGQACSQTRGPPQPRPRRRQLGDLEQRFTLLSPPLHLDLSTGSLLVTIRPQADMILVHISTRRLGTWLAALLLLPAQQALSLSDHILKDVDYPVLPLLSPFLTVRSFVARHYPQRPRLIDVTDRDVVSRTSTPAASAN